ncbi:hypothetical protein J8J40_24280, partial [Mycobacterium tuberculosis]|nr:hypothetical protein [Mycobacterium tuberculosis]
YGLFFVRKVLKVDDAQLTPAHELNDGKNYVPTQRWVTAGHHFAAIAVCVFVGPYVQDSAFGQWLMIKADTIKIILPVYAFFAATLPVWLLLVPRDYLSAFMKVGVFVALIGGVVFR